MFNFSQIRAFFKLLIEYPLLAPYFEALIDFMHEIVKLSNGIKDPIAEFLIGDENSSNSFKTAVAFIFAFILLFFTKFPSFLLSFIQLFLTFFNLILKFFEIQLRLLTFFFENLIVFFEFLCNILIFSLIFLSQSPVCGFQFIRNKLKKKFYSKKESNTETKHVNINKIVLNQKLENNELKILCQNQLINELNQTISSLKTFQHISKLNISNHLKSENSNVEHDSQNSTNENQIINKINETTSVQQTSIAEPECELNPNEHNPDIDVISCVDEQSTEGFDSIEKIYSEMKRNGINSKQSKK